MSRHLFVGGPTDFLCRECDKQYRTASHPHEFSANPRSFEQCICLHMLHHPIHSTELREHMLQHGGETEEV